MLDCKNIHKSFGSAHILKGVTAQIEPGQISVLIGPSGSGKTTLLRALSLIDPPSRGIVNVDGKGYQFPLKEEEVILPPWPQVTVVFQQLFLWPHMTLRENILLPARNIHGAQANEKLEEFLDLFDMRHFIERYPNEASIGQRQRVALVRAVMLNPKYILMDEITSALDVEQVSKVLQSLQMLKERGIGILLITHLMNFARHAADQILFMDGGEIIETGGSEVIDNPQRNRVRQFLSVIEAAS